MVRKFEEMEIGESGEVMGRTVSEADVYRYAGLEGQYGALHVNKPYVEEHSEFDRRIAHGGLSVVFVNGLMGQMPFHHDIIAFYGLDNVRFVNPIFIGDTVHLEAELIDKEVKDDARGILRFKCELKKEDGTVATYMEWLSLVRREEPSSET